MTPPDNQLSQPKITRLPRNGPKPGQSTEAWLHGKNKNCQRERDAAQWRSNKRRNEFHLQTMTNINPLAHLQVGDTVFVVHGLPSWAARQGKEPRTETKEVIKKGRLYGYIEHYGREAKFSLETGWSVHGDGNARDNGFGFDVYATENEYREKMAGKKLRNDLMKRLCIQSHNAGKLQNAPIHIVSAMHDLLDKHEWEDWG